MMVKIYRWWSWWRRYINDEDENEDGGGDDINKDGEDNFENKFDYDDGDGDDEVLFFMVNWI